MEKELEQFRQEVARLRAVRQRGSLPYPEALRVFAVRYVSQALETGGTFAGAAKVLGCPSRRCRRGGRASRQRIGERRPLGSGSPWCRW